MESTELIKLLKVKGLCSDSRKVEPQYAFFALPGLMGNGNLFIQDALDRGAALVITDDESVQAQDRILHVENAQEEMEKWAQVFYEFIPENIILVTGSNGKSSVVHYCVQLLSALGHHAASLGTLGCISSKQICHLEESELTTADLLTLRKNLKLIKDSGINHVALEASSHALDQNRLNGIYGSAVGFSSFTPEHLDYHLSMERYLQAKLRLFYEHRKANAPIVVHKHLLSFLPQDIRSKSELIVLGDKIKIVPLSSSIEGQRLLVVHPEGEFNFFTSILGSYQADNMLLAASLVAIVSGRPWQDIVKLLPNLQPPRGRIERIVNNVFVDFAHNPEGLERLLVTFQSLKSPDQKVWVIFGCGGNRDAIKRPIMGEIAHRLADVVLVTDDNPRMEDPDLIRAEIMKGCPDAKEVAGRADAIKYALSSMAKDDILLIAGKGHEEYQIIGRERFPFSDKQEVLKNCL